jgi:hypothetical protein
MNRTTLRTRLGHGLAAVIVGAALLVPAAAAATGTSYGPHDPWYGYAVSLTQTAADPRPTSRAFLSTGNGAVSPTTLHGFTTDTLAPGGARPALSRGYRFTTDTLAPGGRGQADVGTTGTTFDWGDAGIGAGTAVGGLLALSLGGVFVARRRSRLAT